VLSWSDVPLIDILINNAGVMHLPERILSVDGIEMHFATNHMGHYLLTCLLMPKLISAAVKNPIKGATRIVNLSSGSAMVAGMRWSDINFSQKNGNLPEDEQPNYAVHRAWGQTGALEEQSYLPLEGYNQSKVANVLFGIGANKRLYEKFGILSLALHPGVIPTELSRNMGPETMEAINNMVGKGVVKMKTKEAGVSTTLVAALDPKLRNGETRDGKENWGAFLVDCQISAAANPRAVSSRGAERLWKLSEELVKEEFEW
jgi:NAD(P)-dependent dehydrogenase (short-subunit alcohol dehydrogenase family)